jgi:hypothetical protein
MRAVFLQSPAAALATAVCISVPAVAPHATEAAVARLDHTSVALAASASTLTDSIADTLSKLTLVLSPTGSGAELLALPESIAKLVTEGRTSSVPNTFIEAGRTAGANLVSNLNAAPSTSSLDVFAPYNALINFLLGPSTKTFTSLYGLIAGVGNYLGLPISIGGLLLDGGSAQVPGIITKFTLAAQTALANFPASVAATIQAIFGGFGGLGAASTLKAGASQTLFKAATLEATASPTDGKTDATTAGGNEGTTEGTTGGTTGSTTGGTTGSSTGGTTGTSTGGTTGSTTGGTTGGTTEGKTGGTTGDTTTGTTSGTTAGTTSGTMGGTTGGATGDDSGKTANEDHKKK